MKATSQKSNYLIFNLQERNYAVTIDVVVEVIAAAAPLEVNTQRAFCLGALNYAGRLIPVVSLAELLGYPKQSLSPEQHFLIVRIHDQLLAVCVDGVEKVQELNPQTLKNATRLTNKKGEPQLLWHEQHLVVMIDFAELFSREQLLEIETLIAQQAAS